MRGLKSRDSGKWKRVGSFGALLVLLLLLLNSLRGVYLKKQNAEAALLRMNKEVQDLKDREESLKGSIAKLETTDGVEFELRKKFNVVKEGENVVIIVDEKQVEATSTPNYTTWQKIKNFFSEVF